MNRSKTPLMTSRLVNIDVRRVKPSPYNPRHEAEAIVDLASSIATVGIIEPLVVAVDPKENDKVQLVCGNRRFAAAKRAKLKVVPCIVLPGIDERTQRMISLVENLHRRDMTPIESGEAFRDLMGTGMTMAQVASAVGISEATVSIKVGLLTKLIPEFQELVRRDRMTVSEARAMCRLPKERQQEIARGGRTSQPRLSAKPTHRRSHTEMALRNALDSYRAGDFDMALAEAQRAVGHLSNKAGSSA